MSDNFYIGLTLHWSNFQSLDDPLPRVEDGNYEYRVVLRCRAQARTYFLQLRSDVRVKLQLLNSKHGNYTHTHTQTHTHIHTHNSKHGYYTHTHCTHTHTHNSKHGT